MCSLPDLWRLWSDKTLAMDDIASRLGVTKGRLYKLAAKHALPARTVLRPQNEQKVAVADDGEPEPLFAEPDDDGLRLSPWVAKRIVELGLGWERERTQRLEVAESRVSRQHCGRA